MTWKRKRNFERQVDGLFLTCERVLIRGLMFAYFVYDIGRFAHWLWR